MKSESERMARGRRKCTARTRDSRSLRGVITTWWWRQTGSILDPVRWNLPWTNKRFHRCIHAVDYSSSR